MQECDRRSERFAVLTVSPAGRYLFCSTCSEFKFKDIFMKYMTHKFKDIFMKYMTHPGTELTTLFEVVDLACKFQLVCCLFE